MHRTFFYRARSEAAAYGFRASHECPVDRKTITAVSRDVRLDQLASAFVEKSTAMTHEEKAEWRKVRCGHGG
jgi:hypothetical protein